MRWSTSIHHTTGSAPITTDKRDLEFQPLKNYIAANTDNADNAAGDDSGKAIVSRVQYVF